MAMDLITGTLLILSDLCSVLLLPQLFRMGGEDGLPNKKARSEKLHSGVANAANQHKFRAPSDLELCVCAREDGDWRTLRTA